MAFAAAEDLILHASRVKLAVAFWGNGAIDALGLHNASCPTQIVCDLASGAVNPKEVNQLRRHDLIEIRTLSGLHAKVYWTDTGVVIGSSNASSNGLGFEGAEVSGLIEANILVSEPPIIETVSRWFDNEVWNLAVPITDEAIRLATIAWKKRRNTRDQYTAKPTGSSNLLDRLLRDPTYFLDKRIRIVAYEPEQRSPAAKNALERQAEELGIGNLDCWEDWDPGSDTVVLEFHIEPGNVCSFDGMWRSLTDRRRHVAGQGFIVLCERVKDFEGLRVPDRDGKRLAKLVKAHLAESKKKKPELDMQLGKFGKILAKL